MYHNPYQPLVSLLSNILEAYTTAFFIVDQKNRHLNLAASQSLSKYLPEIISLPLEQSGILSQVQKLGQTIHLDKLPEVSASLRSTVPFYREGESHIKGLFAIPVGDGEGVLYVDTKYGWGFNDKQQKWIREIASVLNELIHRQVRLVQQQDYSRIFQCWRRLHLATAEGQPLEEYCDLFAKECSQLLEAEYAFLAIRESGKPYYHTFASTTNVPRNLIDQRFPVNQGLVGWMFHNEKALLISRLNSETSEHYLFTPSEGLPHQGTLWELPTNMSLGHTLALVLLTREPTEWSADYQQGIAHMLHLFNLQLEQFSFREECQHLQTYDPSSGLYNSYTFEAKMEALLTNSMHNSTPFTLALLQFEPWRMLATNVSPKHARLWRRELASELRAALPPRVLVGHITENRIGFLFPEMTSQDAKPHLSQIMELGQQFFAGKLKGIRLQPHLGAVGFPQDATTGEQLWPLVYRRLYSNVRTKD